jgi:predicted DNA-binding protein with PD1-like motif
MRHQLTDNDHGKPFAVVLETGDEAMSCLQEFVCANKILATELIGIGAFAEATLGYVNWFTNVPHEQLEVASLVGDVVISLSEEPISHVHVVVGKRDGAAFAGHLQKARVRPMLEVILNESSAHPPKIHAPQSVLALIRPKQ